MSSDNKVNIIVLGQKGVGKTSLLFRFTRGIFKCPTTTLFVDHFQIERKIRDKKYILHLWDAGGQDQFKTVVRQFYRKADGVLLVYDVTDMSSFLSLSRWLSDLRLHNEEAVVTIVGNKIDIAHKAVQLDAVRRFSENEKLEFFESSAKTGEHVPQIFDHLIIKVLQKRNVFSGKEALPEPIEPVNDIIELTAEDQTKAEQQGQKDQKTRRKRC